MVLRWISMLGEGFLAIPVIGGSFVIASGYWLLVIMFFIHLFALGRSTKNGWQQIGNTMGLITCLLAWIPFLGMFLHAVTAIVLLVTNLQDGKKVHDQSVAK